MSLLKSDVVEACHQLLESKISTLRQGLEDIKLSLENETKSSVGDKHETARARMQHEQSKLEQQMLELLSQVRELGKVNYAKNNISPAFGSVIYTNNGIFFICIALGKIAIKGTEVFVISPLSPLGKQLLQNKQGSSFELNGTVYSIKKN